MLNVCFVKCIGYIVIMFDCGLVGGYNSNVLCIVSNVICECYNMDLN